MNSLHQPIPPPPPSPFRPLSFLTYVARRVSYPATTDICDDWRFDGRDPGGRAGGGDAQEWGGREGDGERATSGHVLRGVV